MKILGFYLGGHDSNVSLVQDNGNVLYYKAERIKQHKHKHADLQWVKQVCEENDFKPDIICFSDGNRNGLGICDKDKLFQKTSTIPGLFDVETYIIDHHYAHILSGWIIEKKPCKYGISIDGRGDNNIKCTILKYPFNLNKVKIIYKNVERSYCLLFNQIGKYMNLDGGELDYAGKIMGLHAYGTVDSSYVEKHLNEQYARNPMQLLEEGFRGYKISELFKKNRSDFIDWLASIHTLLQNYIVNMFECYIPKNEEIIYSGGCAQNTVYNTTLQELYPGLRIPPHCYDGGISLGCIKFIAMKKELILHIQEFPFCQQTQDLGYADLDTIRQVAKLLSEGKIVGWCQGKGEVGPRALGHRSLLMNPSNKNAKTILNDRVKKRESWRPYAASIRIENISKITDVNYDCPYMLHALKVKQEYYKMFKSVVHTDGTCRFQTVSKEMPLQTYYDLLTEFELLTGTLGILNTSLNLGGKPIVSGREEILNLFNMMDIDAMCIGNELWIKK